MIRRSHRIAVFGMLGLALGVPGKLEAQRHARVHVNWEWGDPGHRARFDNAYRTAWLPRVGAPDPGYLYRPVAGVRIPLGHRPRRGYCRLWYPGVAPGHQPRPRRCHRLRGAYAPGVLVVTWQGPLRPVWDPYVGSYWAGYHDVAVVGYTRYPYRGPAGVQGYGARYIAAGDAWWDAPPPRRARPMPRVRVPQVAHRTPPGRPDLERGQKGRKGREIRPGRSGRIEEGPRGSRGRDEGSRRGSDRGRRGT